MASKKANMKQWHSTVAKLKRADLDAIKLDCSAEDISLSSQRKGGVKVKSRKDLRKEKRQESKAKQHAFWMKKRGIEVKPQEEESDKSKKKRKKKKKRKTASLEEADENETDTINAEDLLAANEKEDLMIARLAKKLGMKKRKNLPTKFREDGLDYLLEVCDPIESPALFIAEDDNDDKMEIGGESSDDEPETTSSKPSKRWNDGKGKESKTSSDEVNDKEEEDANEETGSSLDDEETENDNASDDEDDTFEDENACDVDSESNVSEDEQVDEEVDDYDRDDVSDLKDSDEGGKKSEKYQQSDVKEKIKEYSGESISLHEKAKYVPPHLRKLADQSQAEEKRKLERLKKQLKGLVNRLSEANLASIAQEIEQIYSNHSKNDTNSVLSNLLFDSCVMPTHMPLRMLMEHMMLIAILHSNVGNEVGAFFIQSLVEKFSDLHSETNKYFDGKECDNVLMMTAQLYNFKVIDSLLMYDLIRELVKSFTERDIEMLMLLLKSIGPGLRRDDPASLKEIILEIQAKAATCSDLVKQSRVRFMLDVISALRNNNLRKIPQYDPSLVDNARKQIKAILKNRDSAGDIQLRVSLKDLLQAKDKGRWWVVGSAWAGRGGNNGDVVAAESIDETSASKLLKLAKQQRMNTEIRKNIFCVIMSSEDYIDCFEKLLKLNLKDKQAREIVHVLIDCCLQEKIYNPYYAFLAQKLCEFSRSNQVTFQYSFWDRFKLIATSNTQSLDNLAKLIAHLFASNALSISILKIVGFATIDKQSVRFFTRLFKILLTEYPESTMKNVFARIAPLPKLSLLREGLKIFLRHFLLSKSTKKKEIVDNTRLKELVEIAEAALDGREVIKF